MNEEDGAEIKSETQDERERSLVKYNKIVGFMDGLKYASAVRAIRNLEKEIKKDCNNLSSINVNLLNIEIEDYNERIKGVIEIFEDTDEIYGDRYLEGYAGIKNSVETSLKNCQNYHKDLCWGYIELKGGPKKVMEEPQK